MMGNLLLNLSCLRQVGEEDLAETFAKGGNSDEQI